MRRTADRKNLGDREDINDIIVCHNVRPGGKYTFDIRRFMAVPYYEHGRDPPNNSNRKLYLYRRSR